MKSIYSKLVLVSLLLVTVTASVSARECIECKKTNVKSKAVQSKAAACKRAQSTAELNINNVRALINGYGNMWYDGSVAQYHLPKNSNTCPLFCAALWIGGTDVNDQLRIAALRFGSDGDDYWPGPLRINGMASVDLPVCNAYDKHWIITKAQVLEHKSHFTYPGPDDDFAPIPHMEGYQIPDVIANWPGNGQGDDFSKYLAPFYDADGDGEYDPNMGDYPYYDFDNELCPRTLKAIAAETGDNYAPAVTMEESYYVRRGQDIIRGSILSDQVLKGDQTIWWVFNDMGNTHTETKGSSIGLEIRAQAFAFSTNDEINNMTFYSYEIINRSTYELRETYFSQWVDPDLGYAWDDYVGCDVRRGLGYCYNGKSQDTPGSGSYSGIPPAVGIDFFQGPYMDADGIDNPKIDIELIRDDGYTNSSVKNLLENYKRSDGSYDTIAISDDADLFFALDPLSWYNPKNHPGDVVGNCAINGVNFGNNIIDDERFGMRRFVYYENGSGKRNTEPEKASDYYNYLRGYWRDGSRMKFGGNGMSGGSNVTSLDCDFMFPDDSDPWNWGVDGAELPAPWDGDLKWNEVSAGNAPGDRRFMQSAGPFTLKPGALNYITVGIPFAQATSGDEQTASVDLLRQIDDVCQALFENCFKVLDGPDAPTLTCQELNNEIILYLTNEPGSNNYNESYSEVDPAIVKSYNMVSTYDTVYEVMVNGQKDTVRVPITQTTTMAYTDDQRSYKFEGYQIYQLKDAYTSIADINDASKARLVAQCDVENYYDTVIVTPRITEYSYLGETVQKVVGYSYSVNENPSLPIATLVNYTTNSATGLITPTVMVDGANKGIQHVFRITTDAFASGASNKLVNNKEYYFIAIAYAQNRFKEYSQTEAALLDGQKKPYLAGRKDKDGNPVTPITAIPHNTSVEDGGKLAQSEFGMCPNIIRIEGFGNGGSSLRLTKRSIEELMGAKNEAAKEPGTFNAISPSNNEDKSSMQNPCIIVHPSYEENYGPINVRVIDPLKLHAGTYTISFKSYNSDGTPVPSNANDTSFKIDQYTRWYLVKEGTTDTVYSDFSISRYNEQLFLDYGVAVTLVNPKVSAGDINLNGTAYSDNVFSGSSYGDGSFYGGFVNDGALLRSAMVFENEHQQWLSGVPDNDSYFVYNWIRSGTQYAYNSYKNFVNRSTKYELTESYLDEDYFKGYADPRYGDKGSVENAGLDKTQVYESVVGGLWAPYGLVSNLPFHPGFNYTYYIASDRVLDSLSRINPKIEFNRNSIERKLMVSSKNRSLNYNDLAKLPSVRIVLTSDLTKWTRCPVIEMCDDYTQAEGQARRFSARKHASVDKRGKTCADLGIAPDPTDPNNPAYIDENGMGWFPGYAINTATGERLNIMFGEDSRFVQHNGRDMMWNPTDGIMEGTENYVMGGRHYIYVMNSTNQVFYDMYVNPSSGYHSGIFYKYYRTPSYDAGRWALKMLRSAEHLMQYKKGSSTNTEICYGLTKEVASVAPVRDSISMLYASAAWVNMPRVNSRYAFKYPGQDEELNAGYASNGIPCDVTIDIDVRMPYGRNMSMNFTGAADCGQQVVNKNMPRYQFVINSWDEVIEGRATAENAEQAYKDSLLSLINVVPNPYYSYSEYETASQLETKVRIINLPTGVDANGRKEGCTIRIYTVDGTLVRTLGPTAVTRDVSLGAENTTCDWDLHNHAGIPIAGGMYLIHVSVPGIGERVIKWFGTMRPVDLNSFGF